MTLWSKPTLAYHFTSKEELNLCSSNLVNVEVRLYIMRIRQEQLFCIIINLLILTLNKLAYKKI